MDRDAARLHQVHPAKLATDWITGLGALALLWMGHPLAGLLVLLAPPIAATLLVLRFADVSRLRGSRWGRAVVRRMTPAMQGLRLGGMFVAAAGAWLHAPWEIAAGLALVLAGWATTILDAWRAP